MSNLAQRAFFTESQYLEFERTASSRHEYINGEVIAMAGAKYNHNVISANLTLALGTFFKNKECRVFGSDMRLKIEETGLFTYPDISIYCGEPKFYRKQSDILTNPQVLIEILSPSTENYDRKIKKEHYFQIPSLREYILVASHEIKADSFIRQGDSWFSQDFQEEILFLQTFDFKIPFSEIYAGVKWDVL